MISNLGFVSTFFNKYATRFFLSKVNFDATKGHFLINYVMILIKMISTSFFLSLNSRTLTIDFKNNFYNFTPYSSAAWWITEAAHTPYLYLFFSTILRLIMKSKILSKICSIYILGNFGIISAKYLMAYDCTVSFYDYICFI